MEAAQALMKYKQKMESKEQTKPSKKQTKPTKNPSKPLILYSTQREIEWFKRLSSNFDENFHNLKYLKIC